VVQTTSVGVLDKAVALLDAVDGSPAALSDLVERTGLSRATAHRLAVALVEHGLLDRDEEGRFRPGPRLAPASGGLVALAEPVLRRLRDDTAESAQLYVRSQHSRVCIAVAEPPAGLRDTVPVGTVLPMTAGSAAQVLLAWAPDLPALVAQGPSSGALVGGVLPGGAAFDALALADVRQRGYAATSGEREPGLASVSAPVRRGIDGTDVIAAISLSGPIERLSRHPGRRHGARVVAAADELSRALTGLRD
jgi:DNA-binding IclR family transcriptional regulator